MSEYLTMGGAWLMREEGGGLKQGQSVVCDGAGTGAVSGSVCQCQRGAMVGAGVTGLGRAALRSASV